MGCNQVFWALFVARCSIFYPFTSLLPPLPPSFLLSSSSPQMLDRRIKDSEERERHCLGRVLMEERTWYCGFVLAFSKIVVSQSIYPASHAVSLLVWAVWCM